MVGLRNVLSQVFVAVKEKFESEEAVKGADVVAFLKDEIKKRV